MQNSMLSAFFGFSQVGHLASAEQLQALLQRSKEDSKSAETSIPEG